MFIIYFNKFHVGSILTVYLLIAVACEAPHTIMDVALYIVDQPNIEKFSRIVFIGIVC